MFFFYLHHPVGCFCSRRRRRRRRRSQRGANPDVAG
jgi:hypothetical protein